MYPYNPAQNEPEHIQARLNPTPQAMAALPVLYAKKDKAGTVTIYHDHTTMEVFCIFGRHLTNKPRRNSRSMIVNGFKRLLFWLD